MVPRAVARVPSESQADQRERVTGRVIRLHTAWSPGALARCPAAPPVAVGTAMGDKYRSLSLLGSTWCEDLFLLNYTEP